MQLLLISILLCIPILSTVLKFKNFPPGYPQDGHAKNDSGKIWFNAPVYKNILAEILEQRHISIFSQIFLPCVESHPSNFP